jgi:hypothetical protein
VWSGNRAITRVKVKATPTLEKITSLHSGALHSVRN